MGGLLIDDWPDNRPTSRRWRRQLGGSRADLDEVSVWPVASPGATQGLSEVESVAEVAALSV